LPENPPLIVVKVNDNGTPDTSDDTIVGGSTFSIYLDNGNGVFEPNGADGPALATLPAPKGFAVFRPDAPGDYWIVEVTAPPGLAVADPILVQHEFNGQNCGVLRGVRTCVADDDNSGGFTIAAVVDSPQGGVEPTSSENVTPPSTDVLAAPVRPDPRGAWLAVASVFVLGVVLFARVRRLR
jgi:hypothetical protein